MIKKKSLTLHNNSGRSAVRLAHLLWEQGVEGSNPFTPTKMKRSFHQKNAAKGAEIWKYQK